MAPESKASDRLELETYATLRAKLALQPDDREQLLAEHGLDEDSWETLDEQWQERLSDDLEQHEQIPSSIVRYAEAFARAQREVPGKALSLERFAEATRALQRHPDPTRALQHVGVSFADFLRANQTWAARMAKDRALAERFDRILKGR